MISLKRDHDRREFIQKQFPRYYSEIKTIEAVDAQNESNHPLINNFMHPCKNDKRRPLTQGEKCCAISHLLALEEFLQTGQERCIIIEDDIIGCDEDFDTTINIVKSVQNLKGLIILGGQQGLKNSKYLAGAKTHYCNIWKVDYLAKRFTLRTCCYSVDRSTAKQIIHLQNKCLTRADNWLRLLDKSADILYADIFQHPTDLIQSNLEKERKTKSVFKLVYQDGFINLLERNIYKALIVFFVKIGLAKKLPVKC